VNDRLKSLGLSRQSSAKEIYDALISKVEADNLSLFEFLGKPSVNSSKDWQKVLLFALELSGKPKGFFIKIEKAVEFLKNETEDGSESAEDIFAQVSSTSSPEINLDDFDADGDDDELYDEAKQVVIQAGKASASYLQRRLKVGYARAARLLDMLEENGIIGPGEGAKPREILTPRDNEGREV